MHSLEPFYNWRDYYTSEEDALSPFYQMQYSEFTYSNAIYDHFIHPQWDYFGSNTMYVKIIFVDYVKGFAIIELIGEWNDCINNDIMLLKDHVINPLLKHHIDKFILIGENVLNFHFAEEDYYDQWFDDVEDGWITIINFQEHVINEMQANGLDHYLFFNADLLSDFNWRKYTPSVLFEMINEKLYVPRLK